MDASIARPFAHFAPPLHAPDALRAAIDAACRRPEPDCVAALLPEATLPASARAAAEALARQLVTALRARPHGGGVEALVQEYALSTGEGVALMCLAEALLRIPDAATRDALIRDKLAHGDWRAHLGRGRSLFVNAATWGLVVTGKLAASVDGVPDDRRLGAALTRLLARAGEPIVRRAVDLAMRLMGEQFVMGETIEAAVRRAAPMEARGFRYSYDMLGEAAMTAPDAARYLADYHHAIDVIGAAANARGAIEGPGISIKLSALHPRYARAQAGRVMAELYPRVLDLCERAMRHRIGLSIDAEEADRLDLSLDLIERLAAEPALAGWNGLGVVIQAYGKRCPMVIDWLLALARRTGRRIMVRLVKGAYWDAEIKRAQAEGQADFPVYTRKVHTDLAYIACARRLLAAPDAVFPQFATHNALTLATVHAMDAQTPWTPERYEFQCLHGMGEPLYEEVVGADKLGRPARIYAPVGTHETLLAYLVRRLLENGANSSFVNRIANRQVSLDEIVADPVAEIAAQSRPGAPHPAVALPHELYPDRRNSSGLDLADQATLNAIAAAYDPAPAHAAPDPRLAAAPPRAVVNPARAGDMVGMVAEVLPGAAATALRHAHAAAPGWAATPTEARARALETAADAMQAASVALLPLIMREAGKSAANAVSEVREAVDFLRYYAARARLLPVGAAPLGAVVCVSPWNFPLAIFTGQVAAALAAGNTVVAKPAEETPLIAARAVALLHAAGVPADVLQLVPGDGAVGAALIAAPETAGVLFTGSTEVGRLIQRGLAPRLSPTGTPIPLVAETGGQNALVVDSSALAEQVVADVLASAFDSAGQRCSALRVLCLQADAATPIVAMLKGAMAQLSVGPTDVLANDLGPVISAEAQAAIEAHVAAMQAAGCVVTRAALPEACAHGTFVAPTLIEIESLDQLGGEVFGPVLHVLRFARDDMEALIARINALGFGLTFGLHTRLDQTIARVCALAEAGNIYINRNQIGAVVGVQPFGGHGLSGTGPKAGGPLTLPRLIEGEAPAPFAPAGEPAPDDPLSVWLASRGHVSAAVLARRLASDLPLATEVALPGPVGERNLYRLDAAGPVLVAADTEPELLALVAVALAAGGSALVAQAPGLAEIPEGVPPALAPRIVSVPLATPEPLARALAAGSPETLVRVQAALAAREGALVPLIHGAGLRQALLLLREVSVSVNTTAAGGNASLMALV